MLIEQMIRLKMAEIYDLAGMLAQPPQDVQALAQAHPGMWAQRLAEMALLDDYSGRLPEEFARKAMPSAGRRLTSIL